MGNGTFFDDVLSQDTDVVRNGLCVICKGSKDLCGKGHCPLMAKFYSRQPKSVTPSVTSTDIAGTSPPSVFVGRYGYPKVDIGPLLPQEFGDTSLLDSPERWVGRRSQDIVNMRFQLIRGKYRIDAKDFDKSGRIVDSVQELAMTARPTDLETRFDKRPAGRPVLDDSVEPFGPSGRMSEMRVGNSRFERQLERNFYDTDLRARDAVVEAYRSGTQVSDINKAFSVGTMGVGKDRRFVPTRWSITAVDDIISKDLAERTRHNNTIDEFRVYFWNQLGNRWAIIMMPCSWRFEMIEAWYPKSSWNTFSSNIDFEVDSEGFDGRTTYARMGGSYYAARLAACEMLERENRSAGVIVCREIHPEYDVPLGVWNIRENMRAALRYDPVTSDTLEGLGPSIDSFMDVHWSTWKIKSEIAREWKVQKRLDDFFRGGWDGTERCSRWMERHQPDGLRRGNRSLEREVPHHRMRTRPVPVRFRIVRLLPQPLLGVHPRMRPLPGARGRSHPA